ncbi:MULTISPECIES: hypothetical protein [unclassified Streptomyces]|uniref:hypothetical protein n=1 Tax=unclassified Streptomyces TaxID=2593676 RepID=UPI000B6F2FD8|nr:MULTISPECIES: hypothetical protein [unclassified Streptomyces]SNB71724.1 hypothetical protein SAMN02745831_00843 [Streptomyces sp. PgraA7]
MPRNDRTHDNGRAGFVLTSPMCPHGEIAKTGQGPVGLATTAELTLQLRLAIVAQTLLLPLLRVDSFLGTTAAVAAIGFAVAPHLIAVFTLAEQVAPLERMGEAMTLLGSGLIVGQDSDAGLLSGAPGGGRRRRRPAAPAGHSAPPRDSEAAEAADRALRRGPRGASGHWAGRRGVRGGSVRRLPVFSKAAARERRALSS